MLMQAFAPHRPNPGLRKPANEAASAIDLMAAPMSVARGVEIYAENDSADYFYKVVSGCVCTSRILAQGRRQIGAFYFPGDVFGLEAGDVHAFAADAVTDCNILVVSRNLATVAASADAVLAMELWMLTRRELQRAQSQVMLLVKNAQERVATFLLDMAGRARSSSEFYLPMSRRDIADYLGLTIETVSRIFSGLEDAAAIALPSARHVVLRDRRALQILNN